MSSLTSRKILKPTHIGFGLLILLLIVSVITLWLSSPLIQDEMYHNFSDKTSHFGIPNFWNVVSNLPFLLVGIMGVIKLNIRDKSRLYYQIFFGSIALVAIGSGYYHYNPNTQTLVWDRLPMTLGFMALLALIISEFINEKLGHVLFIPLLGFGLCSIIIWVFTKDLRYYALVQFFPILAIPIILICFKSYYTLTSKYWLVFGFYVLAKVFEHFDCEIFEGLMILSGHTLKHFAAATSIIVLFYVLQRRKRIQS